MNAESNSGKERRQFIRIDRNFILTYAEKDHPNVRNEMTQVRNISRGGVCFVSTRTFVVSTILLIEMRTPFTTGSVHLEGVVLESRERIKNLIYDVRLQFQNLQPQAAEILEKIEQHSTKGRS